MERCAAIASLEDPSASKPLSSSSSPSTIRRQRTRSHDHSDDVSRERSAHRSSCEAFEHCSSDRPHPISHPLHRETSTKERKMSSRLVNTNHSRTSSNRSRLSSTTPGIHRMDRHRRKALKLLIVIILDFFICWTPLFLYHTFGTFQKKFYRSMPTIFIDLILLFSFASALCNPFTYYFMSKRYRAVLFAHLSACSCNTSSRQRHSGQKNQEAMQIINALRLHQQQNSLEYKKKNASPVLLRSPVNTRSKTFK